MTYIEFYDRLHLSNVCATIDSPPERVILVGDNARLLASHAKRYSDIISARSLDVKFEYRSVASNNLDSIVSLLSDIVSKREDCVFDLTGGGEIYLLAAGIVLERHKDKSIKMCRYDLISSKLIKYDLFGNILTERRAPKLSVEENIRLYGGEVICTSYSADGAKEQKPDRELTSDVLALWDICRVDVKAWNKQIAIFSSAETKKIRKSSALMTESDAYQIRRSFSMKESDDLFDHEIIDMLSERGLVLSYGIDGGVFRIRYKNAHVKKCLTNPGLVLENIIWLCAKKAKYKNGCHVYNDAKYSVRIDWDGDVSRRIGKYDTENEIDVIMMHGSMGVFVSCKNGSFGMDELYKLHAVAHRFGGKYSKKVLVATAVDSLGGQAHHIRQRAADMNIKLVEGATELSFDELTAVVKGFWK